MNERQIWDYFIQKGLTPEGTAGLMGNLWHESGLRADNLQNTFEKSLGMDDATYTAAVDAGIYDNFVHDSAGYGLAQWTFWSRKEALLKYIQKRGTSIGDIAAQLDFLVVELTGNYGPVWDVLTTTKSVREASDTVLLKFERPADQSEEAQLKRYRTSHGFYDRLMEGEPMAKTRTISPLALEMVSFGGINSNPRLNPVTKITPHHMAGINSGAGCARSHLANPAKQASANYYIGNDGDICAGVTEDRRAWTSGTGNEKGTNDHMAITIEVSNNRIGDKSSGKGWTIGDKAYKSLVSLCADICTFYGIVPHFDGTKNGSITMHKQFQATACPGEHLESLIRSGQLERDIIQAMGNPQPTPAPQPAPEQPIYRVQVGAFANRNNADKQLADLKAKGEDGIIVRYDNLYKVQVGAFANKVNADNKAAELKAKGYKIYITTQGGTMVASLTQKQTYTVKSGDSLGAIAKKYGTTVAHLQAANSIKDANLIFPGQVLTIP